MARNKNIDWDAQPLGKVLDAELAKSVGVSHGSVAAARKKRGIPALHPEWGNKNVDWDVQPLGKVSDREIAKSIGVRQPSVHAARTRRGIPAYTLKCSVCGARIKTCGKRTSMTPSCRMCANYVNAAKNETCCEQLIILRAKAVMLANLTAEKILEHKERQNEKRD